MMPKKHCAAEPRNVAIWLGIIRLDPVTRAREIRAFWRKIGNSIAASAQVSNVRFLSTAGTAALNDRTVCCLRMNSNCRNTPPLRVHIQPDDFLSGPGKLFIYATCRFSGAECSHKMEFSFLNGNHSRARQPLHCNELSPQLSDGSGRAPAPPANEADKGCQT